MQLPRNTKKTALLVGIIGVYIAAGLFFTLLLAQGMIQEEEKNETTKLSKEETITHTRLQAAKDYFTTNMVENNSHVNLYLAKKNKEENTHAKEDYDTNSEAISYYLQWSAQAKDKERFDQTINYIEKYMKHPQGDYLMWRLNEEEQAETDGKNIATDADLRAIKALAIAKEQWPEDKEKYQKIIDELADSLEKVGLTKDKYLAPYGGMAGVDSWHSEEVWLSYVDFTAIKTLAEQRGEPWNSTYENMKKAVLKAQIHNGLYNSMLTITREYGNSIDGGGYSINSLWILVRSAESDDETLKKSAKKSLAFYKQQYEKYEKIHQKYDSAGQPLIEEDAPWAYALVARAASELGEENFSRQMLNELAKFQEHNKSSPYYGAIIEGSEAQPRIGQFTMQESILSMQSHLQKKQN